MPSPQDDRRDTPEEAAPQHPAGPIPGPAELTETERRKAQAKDDERLRSDPTGPGAR